MYKRSRFLSDAVLTSALFCSFSMGTAQADVALTFATSQANDMVMNVTNGKASMVMDMGSQGKGRMIYDSATDKILMVMDSQQQYMDMDEMVQAMGGLSDMLAGAMAGMDDQTKSKLGGLLGGLTGKKKKEPKSSVEETGRSESVNGIACDVVLVEDADVKFEMCLADHDQVGVSDKDFAVLQKMMKKQQSMSKQMSSVFGNQSALSIGNVYIDRVPVKTKSMSGVDGNMELKSVSAQADASSVSIPEGYTKANMSGG